MPAITIIIPAYNVGDYIAQCIESVRNQTSSDFEALVIDDASTDNTHTNAQDAIAGDRRFKLLTNNKNLGTHLTRLKGIENATGDMTFFLDGDDAIDPTMCETLINEAKAHPADITQYGLKVIGANQLLESERRAFEHSNNTLAKDAAGEDILRNSFDEKAGFHVNWRFTQRLYRTSLLKQSLHFMTHDRLGRSQDGYEYFVVAALAQSYHAFQNYHGYLYFYGRGISGTSTMTAEKYARYCQQFKADFDATDEFAATRKSEIVSRCALGFREKATELLANDLSTRVSPSDRKQAAKAMADVFGPCVCGRELYRFVRDQAYAKLSHKSPLSSSDAVKAWNSIAAGIHIEQTGTVRQRKRYIEMRTIAESHFTDLVAMTKDDVAQKRLHDGGIHIFVTAHKDAATFDSSILQPVQVGPAGRRPIPGYLQDDTGENISADNARYCELTTQYWAWKNVDADYYGFCHYRRYFDFSAEHHTENAYGEVMDTTIDKKAARRYGINDANIEQTVRRYDVITTPWTDLLTKINRYGTPRKLWHAADALHDDDLTRCASIVRALHPDYAEDVMTFLDGHSSCFCNMFIMRRALFFSYCEWLFPILKQFDSTAKYDSYSKEALRTVGHLGERLLNIWLIHQKRTNPVLKFGELQCVHFTEPERPEQLSPTFSADKPTIPIVLAADDKYVPQVTTTISSLLANASSRYLYDIWVFDKDISDLHQDRMRAFISRYPNAVLHFTNVSRYLSRYRLSTNNPHITVETYYRFLIQRILNFYDKVIYLDADLVVNGDISELYATSLDGMLLGAIHDIDFMGNLNVKNGKRLSYAHNVLGMHDPYAYFQAGVLLLNTKELRAQRPVGEWLRFASNPRYIYNDQDVLNALCEGKVRYLPWEWNVMPDLDGRVGRLFALAPARMFTDYLASRTEPKIIHYAGYKKPWTDPDCEFGDVFWHYARQTPFYEALLRHQQSSSQGSALPQRAISVSNPLRKIVDPLAPVGSHRREILKAVGRALRNR